MIGVLVAILGNILIGLGLSIQKLAHKNNIIQNISYICLPSWWIGISIMVIGEIGNFVAYSMVQASVVTPLGAVAVIFNAILSSVWLRENITWYRIAGIICTILGIVSTTINAPYALEENKDTYNNIISWRSFVYFLIVIVAAILIANYGKPQKYFLSCSMVYGFMGIISVASAKALSTTLNLALSNKSTAMFIEPKICWLTYIIFFTLPTSIFIQINFLNKALKYFDSSQVIPTYYTIFTTFCLTSSTIVFREIQFENDFNIALFIIGLLLAYLGIYIVIRFNQAQSNKIQVIIIETHEEEEEFTFLIEQLTPMVQFENESS